MTRAWVRQEVRPLRFEARNERRQQRILTRVEAGEMLGVTERSFRCGRGRSHVEGAGGRQDRRIGRRSPVRGRSMRRPASAIPPSSSRKKGP